MTLRNKLAYISIFGNFLENNYRVQFIFKWWIDFLGKNRWLFNGFEWSARWFLVYWPSETPAIRVFVRAELSECGSECNNKKMVALFSGTFLVAVYVDLIVCVTLIFEHIFAETFVYLRTFNSQTV